MLTFAEYIERAKENNLIRNKSQIADILGISRGAIRNFEVQKSYPSETTMIKLAKLSNISEKQALIDLRSWKSGKNPYTNKIWQELSKENKKEKYKPLTFTQYVEKAKENSQIDSNNKVASKLGISSASIAIFCNERGYPSQETVLKLANLAGVSPEKALIDFNLWKTKDKPNAQKVWLKLAKMIGCWILAVNLNYANSNDYSFKNLLQSHSNTITVSSPIIYYG